MVNSRQYTITIEPALTPAEWFFHVRNLADEVYRLGYEMRDFADINEAGRQSILAAKKLDKFSGLIGHGDKTVDRSEMLARIEKYANDREYSLKVTAMDLREPTQKEIQLSETPTAKVKTGDSEHYYIEFFPAVNSAEWFFHARNLADLLALKGYEMRDFHDGFVLDRQQILRAADLNFFEGFFYSNEPLNLDDIWEAVGDYLKAHGLALGLHHT